MNYIIIDWAYNQMFNNKTFKTFEDAWGYIYEHVKDEEDYQEYLVITENELNN